MSVTFRPAKREGVPLLIGLAGGTGSGKTYSALLIASGIAGPNGRIAAIDTENGRMLHYADEFKFDCAQLTPPFTPQAYEDAIVAADQAGYDCIVIDSMSHEWAGEGGVRDWADRLEAGENGQGGLKAPAQWKLPKLAHKKLVNRMLACRAHIVVCLRAEEKMKIEQIPQTNPDGSPKMWQGKQSMKMAIIPALEVPLKERWHPVCEKGFPFEITTSILLLPSAPGVPVELKVQQQHKPAFPEGQPIGRAAGEFLAAWARGETPGAAPAYTEDDARAELAGAEDAAELERAWRHPRMRPHREALADLLSSTKAKLTTAERPMADI